MDFDGWDRLRSIGLTQAVAERLTALEARGVPLRVSEVHRDSVAVTDGDATHPARALPALWRMAPALAVGDWVVGERDDAGTLWLSARMEPLTQLVRRNGAGERQVLVTNVDTALLLMGLDGDFNLRRLERYLALVSPEAIWPVVVLTKADLAPDAQRRCAAVAERIGGHVDVLAVNALDAHASAALQPYLGAGHTLVLLGSSGAGKSTLTNTLLGRPAQSTGAVRSDDSRGRHTTVVRSLHRLPAGGCVIDTPGLRGLQPDVDAVALAASFGDIDTLAAQCRFRDCTHRGEPGCAVQSVVPPDRLANYQKMLRDIRRESMTPLERRELLATWKARHRAATLRMKMKRG